MSQQELLSRLVELFAGAGIPFMVTGSMASAHFGEPRSTMDIDIVIDPTAEQLDEFLRSLGDNYYVSAETAREALRKRTMFNVVGYTIGWKADLIVRKDRPFSIAEFARKQEAQLQGVPVFITTAEDVILSKLEWAKLGESQRQLRDVAGVIEMAEKLDEAYLRQWATELGVEEMLDDLMP